MSTVHNISKPANLIYGVEERPPLPVTILQGLQQLSLWSVGLLFVVVLARTVDLSPSDVNSLISLTMIASGVGTILQSRNKGFIGSGYLCPEGVDPSFLAVTIMAAQKGGLPLAFGMTMFGGVLEAFLSRIIPRLRVLFPSEVTGTIILMVSITIVPIAMSNFMGISGSDTVSTSAEVIVGVFSIVTMVAVNLWGKNGFQLYALLIGITAGYILSGFLGIVAGDSMKHISQAPLFKIPILHRQPIWAFDWSLVLPFAVATLCSTLKNVGDITSCQKINDTNWRRTDLKSVQGGLMADAAASFTGGLLGGMGQASYAGNIGLSVAAGATSRYIGYAMGGMVILLGLFPKLAAAFASIPPPVMGASLIFAITFMILSGIQIIASRMIDARKTFVIGISIIVGLSPAMIPGLYSGLPGWLQPMFTSPLSLATITVVILNIMTRIGLKKTQTIEFGTDVKLYETMSDFLEKTGQLWGARPEIVKRAIATAAELFETIDYLKQDDSIIRMEASFDELNLDLNIYYQGELFELCKSQPDPHELLECGDNRAIQQLSGLLVSQLADASKSEYVNGQCHVYLHYDH